MNFLTPIVFMMGFIFTPKDMLTSDFDLSLKLNEYLWQVYNGENYLDEYWRTYFLNHSNISMVSLYLLVFCK